MNEYKINGTFISEKISKIRWQPEQYTESTNFLTGSWSTSNEGSLKSWKIIRNDTSISNENDFAPKCCANLSIDGDINGLEFVNSNTIVVGSSDGNILAFYDVFTIT